MPGNLTERQETVLIEIGRCVRDRGIAPTIRELTAAIGLSISPMFGHVRKLERAGYLQRFPGSARGLVLTDAGAAWLAERGVLVDPARDRTQSAALEEAARLVVLSPTQAHLRALGRALEAVAS